MGGTIPAAQVGSEGIPGVHKAAHGAFAAFLLSVMFGSSGCGSGVGWLESSYSSARPNEWPSSCIADDSQRSLGALVMLTQAGRSFAPPAPPRTGLSTRTMVRLPLARAALTNLFTSLLSPRIRRPSDWVLNSPPGGLGQNKASIRKC